MKHSNFVLTSLGMAGYGLSLYFASEEFPEMKNACQMMENGTEEPVNNKHKLWCMLKHCKKTVITYTLSTTAIIVGQKLTYDKLVAASAAITASGRELYKNRNTIREMFGHSAEDIRAEQIISSTTYENDVVVYDNETNRTYYDITVDDVHCAFRIVNEELAKNDHVEVTMFYESLLGDDYHNEVEQIKEQWSDYCWWGCDILTDSMETETEPLKNPIIRYEIIPHKTADGKLVYSFEFVDLPTRNPFY